MNLAAWAERSGVARVSVWAATQLLPVDKVVTEVGSAPNGRRGALRAVLGDPSVGRVVVEHRDRFCWFGSQYVQAALAAQDASLLWWIRREVDDDLVRDMTEILSSMCARLCGERVAANRAKRAVAAAADAGEREAA
jgi:predicted site-specific integrase-resolvase